MHPLRSKRLLASTLLGIAFSTTSLLASGFSIYEQGAKATAMGGAFTATADDPSAMFYNVAGIAYQRKLAASAGATLITFHSEFQGDDQSYPGPEATGFYEDHAFVLPNVYAVIPIGENLTVGFAQFSGFGLRTDWENGNTFPGRFISQDANLKTVSLQPSIAWKTSNGKFAVGAGAEYRTSHISLERNSAAVFLGRVFDVAHVRLNSDWNHAWGYNVGLMFKPAETLSLGFQYRADMDIDYEGDAKFTQISTGIPALDARVAAGLPPSQNITTTLSFPALYSFGVATTAIDTWNIEFDSTYTTWDRFKSLQVAFETTPANNLNVDEHFKNTFSYRLGANHKVTDNWDIRLGTVYDESPQPVDVVGPLLPDSDRLGATFGVGFHSDHWTIDVSEMVLHFFERNTLGQNHDNFNGIYKTNANLFSMNIGYNF